jgi:hypothetical protein
VILYHVTKTSSVPRIKKQGILPLQTSNWIQAGSRERYGSGEIFAFEHIKDAIRWAIRWDWILTASWGSGKVSIVEFTANSDDWIEDTADPLGQASREGRWLKLHGRVKPSQILRTTRVTEKHIRAISG